MIINKCNKYLYKLNNTSINDIKFKIYLKKLNYWYNQQIGGNMRWPQIIQSIDQKNETEFDKEIATYKASLKTAIFNGSDVDNNVKIKELFEKLVNCPDSMKKKAFENFDNLRSNAYHVAINTKNKDIIKMVLDNVGGSNISSTNISNAISNSIDTDLIEQLIKKFTPLPNSPGLGTYDKDLKSSCLTMAMYHGKKELVKHILEKECKEKCPDKSYVVKRQWNTEDKVSVVALTVGDIDIINMLINYGMEISDEDSSDFIDEKPVLYDFKSKLDVQSKIKLIEQLIKEKKIIPGSKLFNSAIRKKNKDFIKLLFDNGAKGNTDSGTALVSTNDADFIEYIIANNIVEKIDTFAILKKENNTLLQSLINKKVNPGFNIFDLIKIGDIEYLKSNIDNIIKKDKVAKDSFDKYLNVAIEKKDNKIIETLYTKFKEYTDYFKNTKFSDSIYSAVSYNNMEIFKLLLNDDINLIHDALFEKVIGQKSKEMLTFLITKTDKISDEILKYMVDKMPDDLEIISSKIKIIPEPTYKQILSHYNCTAPTFLTGKIDDTVSKKAKIDCDATVKQKEAEAKKAAKKK